VADLATRLATRDRFLDCLRDASQHRDERWDTVDNGHGPEPAWVGYEASQMLDLVNRIRGERGRPPASIEQVRRIESSAAGHVDYAEKYALRCAFLALEIAPNASRED